MPYQLPGIWQKCSLIHMYVRHNIDKSSGSSPLCPNLRHATYAPRKSRLESVSTTALKRGARIDSPSLRAASTSASSVHPLAIHVARAIPHDLKFDWALLTEAVLTDCAAARAVSTPLSSLQEFYRILGLRWSYLLCQSKAM